MHEQLVHLAEMSRLPNISVEVVPYGAGAAQRAELTTTQRHAPVLAVRGRPKIRTPPATVPHHDSSPGTRKPRSRALLLIPGR